MTRCRPEPKAGSKPLTVHHLGRPVDRLSPRALHRLVAGMLDEIDRRGEVIEGLRAELARTRLAVSAAYLRRGGRRPAL